MKLFDILPHISLAFFLMPSGAQAQPFDNAQGPLAPDNSLGAESSVVTPVNQTTDRIDGGAARGSNLFHSFSDFNVDVGRSVYFANPPAIENILTRVTGGNQSNIMGPLGVLGDANLFLVNPNGIVFGREARLDIRGSFFATTGDGIRLGENGLFSATDLNPSKLLHVRPEALFTNALINHMAKLNNRGNLAVGTGSTLVLHGGEVTNSGSLTAPSGTVMVLGERIGLLDDALIDVSSETGGGRVFIGGFLQGLGDIPTAARTYIGPDVTISADAALRGDGGNVIVWADKATGFYGNISARGGLYGGDGGFVEVSGARRLIFRGNVDTTAALGKAGTLLLDPRNIIIANGSPLMEVEDAESIPFDMFDGTEVPEEVTIYESQLEGLSGDTNVVLQATNDIRLADLEDNSLSLARGTGDITFIADADRDGAGDFSMADPADTINTNGRDIAITGASLTLGNIDTSIPASDGAGELLSTAAVVSTEPGVPLENISGNISSATDVDLYQIYLTGEGTFSATTVEMSNVDTQLFLFDRSGLGVYGNDDNSECNCFQSTLPAGDPLTPTAPGIYYLGITVFGLNPVSSSGEIFAGDFGSILEPTGPGGALPLLSWNQVGGDNLGDYSIALRGVEAASTTFAEGNSGAITLTATNGNITAGDLNAASLSGAGGEIRLEAAADIIFEGSIVDASGVVGGGRDITLNSGGSISLNNSFLNSSTNGRGDAGKVTMTANDTVRFSGGGASSEVNSSGMGSAGGIEINTGTLEVTDGAQLSARTAGVGDAGNIKITATESILFAGESSQGASGGAFSSVAADAVGSAGGIEINTGTLEVTDGALLLARTSGEGDAGNIKITASQSVLFAGENSQGFGSGAFSAVRSSAIGNARGIEISTGTLSVTDGGQLSARTLGRGDAGIVKITATQDVLFAGEDSQGLLSGAFSRVEPDGVGSAGGIEIATGTLSVTDGAQLSARTAGVGDGGNVTITATESILFAGESSQGAISGAFSSVAADGVGSAGRIEINTGTLSVTDGAQLTASILGEGDGGNVTITAAESILFAGESSQGLISGAFSTVNSDGVGSTGRIEITTGRLDVIDGALLSASTFGEGDGGKIAITATEKVLFTGESTQGLLSGVFSSVELDAVGSAGGIEINTGTLEVTDGAQISASISGEGDAGKIKITATERILFAGESSQEFISSAFSIVNSDGVGDTGGIEINTGTLDVIDGAQISASTFGKGDSGNIKITATERILFTGDSSQGIISAAFSSVEPDAVGSAGGIEINTGTLSVTNGGQLSASISGEGDAGKIKITATERILFAGESSQGITSAAFSRVNSDGVGSTGGIEITTGTLDVIDGAQISASTFGKGDAENVKITASQSVLFAGEDSQGLGSGAFSRVESSARGNARGIEIATGTFSVTDGGQVSASTFGVGDAGIVKITATQDVLFAGENSQGLLSGAFSRVEPDAVGDARGIEIATGTLSVTDGGRLSASTFGKGDAGTVQITATESVLFTGESPRGLLSGAFSTVEPDAVGDARGIEITTGTLSVTDGAVLNANVFGEGDAGNITITATNSVLFAGVSPQGFNSGAFSIVRPNAVGNARGIEITTGTLSVTDGAQLSASTFGVGNAENINIIATGSVLFAGESPQGLLSGAFSRVEPDAVGDAGKIEINTGILSVTDGALLSASTLGKGNANNVSIEASEAINILGVSSGVNSGGLFADTASEAIGETGNIILSTPILKVGEAGVINATTRNNSRGGNIVINTNSLAVTGGAQIISSSSASGDAGTIAIDATDRVTISGTDPTYDSRVASLGDNVDSTGPESAILSSASSRGTAGSITLKTGQLRVNSGALLSVSSAEGVAGSLNLTADAINLNDGTLSAETADGDQGNINLTASDIRLFSESKIITDATDRATGGDINIDTNILVLENSNITARAVLGQGGNIQITTEGIFQDNVSIIDASASEGIDGTVEIQAQIDPARGLVPLGESPIDASSLISKGCEEYRGSEFIITGRGGIPPHPFETLPGEVIWLDWRALRNENSSLGYSVPSETLESSEVVTPEEGELKDDEIRQAQGWLQLPDGTVVLTAYPVKMTPAGPAMQHPGCQIILGDSEQ